MGKFAYWKGKIIDHSEDGSHTWKQALKVTESTTIPITMAYLDSIHVGFGDTALPIAANLETFLSKVFGETMYGNRRGLCGGTEEEEGNGLPHQNCLVRAASRALWKAVAEYSLNHKRVSVDFAPHQDLAMGCCVRSRCIRHTSRRKGLVNIRQSGQKAVHR